MDKNELFVLILILLIASNACTASLFHQRKLITNEPNSTSATSQVSPAGSPVNESTANGKSAGKSESENLSQSQASNQNSSTTSPHDSKDSKTNGDGPQTSGPSSPPAGQKNIRQVDKGDNNGSCEGSLTSCSVNAMLACIESSGNGSKEMFLVVRNEGENTLKVNVNFPNPFKPALPDFEVPKHKTRRVEISSTVGKNTEVIVRSENEKCVLPLVNPVSVDNLINQLSFYSKQVTPIYAVYASFILALLFGGTLAYCKLRKRTRLDRIPYQELEMGLPDSASAVENVEPAEGWDHDWDDDWDEDSAIKSPGGQRVRSISADGLASRSTKKDGWENDWDV